MSLIKPTFHCILIKNSRLLLLFFIIPFCFSFSQNSLADSVVNYYKTKNSLNYSVKRLYYATSENVCDTFYANIYLSRCPKELYYLVDYKKRYVAINNNKYKGYNDLIDKKYVDYTAFKYDYQPIERNFKPAFIFSPDTFKATLTGKKRLVIRRINYDHLIVIETIDTVKFYTRDSSTLYKQNTNKYYISRLDYSILKTSNHPHTIRSDGDHKDSIVYIYKYNKIKNRSINDSIRNFQPIKSVDNISKSTDSKVTTFPDFNLKDTSNTSFSSSNVNSKYTLIEFWYKGCSPCLANMKNLENIRKSFSSTELTIIAINETDKIDNNVKTILRKLNCSFDFLFGPSKLTETLSIKQYPSTYIYSSHDRKIVFYDIGGGPGYSENIINFLAKKIR